MEQQNYNPKEVEAYVRSFWENNKIREKIEQTRKVQNKGKLGYVEGPPTLNGRCHAGHSRGRALKDIWYRFNTMRGYYVLFRAGWDTQGLPVELEVERELNLKNKKAIETEFGLERFIEEVKKNIEKYHQYWLSVDKKFGLFLDYEKEYMTYRDDYIEREWKYLKVAWERGLLSEGYRVVAYCPGCQTALSDAEVGLGYELLEDPSIYFKFKLKGSENTYLLVWTTMPFTIVTDMLVAVKPDADYVLVETNQGNLILANERVQILEQLGLNNYKVLKEFKGKDLIGTKYEHPLLDLISGLKKIYEKENIHRIVGADFVDLTTGTGIVHLSPGNGEEDFNVGVQEGLSVFSPFDSEVKFTEDAGYFSGMFARDADDVVIKLLEEKGLLVKKEKIEHLYPTCWRSHHRLIFVARREYYLWTNKIVDDIIKAAEKVEYFYEEPKNRFISILKEGKPWCISRERYWGTPLPIFVCEKCGHKKLVSSRKEIVESAIELPDGQNFELHRPWIDKIKLKCEKCGGVMHREPFVLDTWHNSGAAPFASFSDEEFSEFVPVDFLTEGIDQTRGWANRLLILNVILKGKPEPPYKAFLFQGHVLDEQGRKMSKSLGNVVDSEEMIDKYSADLYRFYLVWKASPIESMSFNEKEIMERPFQVLSTFFNLCKFFLQNAKYDNYSWDNFDITKVNLSDLSYADKWILSKTQRLIANVTDYIEKARYHHALRELENFIVNILSRMYVPSIRQEFWFEEDERKVMTRYAILFYVLLTVAKLMNPATPFITEYVYQNVFKQFSRNLSLSINLEEWPKSDEKFLFKEEKTLDVVFKVVPVILHARQKAGIKRRWPLQKATLVIEDSQVLEEAKKARNLIEILSNVKEVDFISDKRDLNLKLEVSLDLQKLGPKYKKKLGDILREVKNNEKQIAYSLLESGKATIFSGSEQIQLTNEDVKITCLPPEGTVFVEDEEKKISVLLSKERDEALIAEGVLRDIARRIQDARKRAGLNPPEIINQVVLAGLDDENKRLLENNLQELAKLVRAKTVTISEDLPPSSMQFDYDFEGCKLRIGIKKL